MSTEKKNGKHKYTICQQCKKEKTRAPRSPLGEKCFRANRLATFAKSNAKKRKAGYKPRPRLVRDGKLTPWAKEHPAQAVKLAKSMTPKSLSQKTVLAKLAKSEAKPKAQAAAA